MSGKCWKQTAMPSSGADPVVAADGQPLVMAEPARVPVPRAWRGSSGVMVTLTGGRNPSDDPMDRFGSVRSSRRSKGSVAGPLFDERLGAEDGQEFEAFGVLAAGLGRVDHDAQIAALDPEHVAIQRHGTHLGVIHGFAGRFVPAHG